MLRRFILAAGLLVAVAPAGHAADATAPVAALHAGLTTIMRAGKATPFAQRYAQLAPVVERAFDLPAILRASVGPAFARLQPADQSALADALTRFTVASYVGNFDTNDGTHLDIGETRAVGTDMAVRTDIVEPSGEKHRIDYLVRGDKIVDVLLDGTISRVAVQRSDFRALLKGDSAAPLIDSLKSKTTELAGGAKF